MIYKAPKSQKESGRGGARALYVFKGRRQTPLTAIGSAGMHVCITALLLIQQCIKITKTRADEDQAITTLPPLKFGLSEKYCEQK